MPDRARIAEGCSLHEGSPFVAICKRCGSYMCARCNDQGRSTTCEACRERQESEHVTSFPLARQSLRLGPLFGFAFQVYTRNIVLLSLVLLAWLAGNALPMFLLSALLELSPEGIFPLLLMGLLTIAQLATFGLFSLGALDITLRLCRGQPAQLGMIVQQRARTPSAIVHALLASMVFGISTLLVFLPVLAGVFSLESTSLGGWLLLLASALVIAGVAGYVLLGLAFSYLELLREPRVDTFTALGNSFRLVRGKRTQLVIVLLTSWFLFNLGTAFCCVGALFTVGYALTLFCSLYLGVENGGAPDASLR